MQIICSWCGKFIKEKEPLWDKSKSGGICEECYENVRKEMKIEIAIQIARREWENIRTSLQGCGDTGEFFSQNHENGNTDPTLVSEGLLLVRNLIRMENKLPTHGYFTPEAASVFTALASKAGKRLGLTDGPAQVFGSGYSWVRTGWFDPDGIGKQHVVKQMFFLKFFSPLGGDFIGWDFDSSVARTKMKLVFDTFVKWQDNPWSYIQDIRDYREQLKPMWTGLSLALDFSIGEFPE